MPGRHTRRRFLSLSAAVAAGAALPASKAFAAGECHPITTEPEFLGQVPTPSSVLGFEVGLDQEVSVEDVETYLDVLEASSDRVVVGTLGHSVLGRPIRYAIVGDPDHVTPAGLAEIRRAHLEIRSPSTPGRRVARLAADTPAFLWVGANIHGNEESGTDAALTLLHGLADRTDCVVRGILRQAVVIVIPCQNPDGRVVDFRRNDYAVDLNRDYLSRTQPETDGKVELMRRYPPLLFLDHHEFGYYQAFFPPNDDPIYHEVTDEVLYWINDVYGPAIAEEFDRTGYGYFNRGQGYDFFAPIFTDTATSFGFQGTGMTIEVYNGAPIIKRWKRQLSVMWVTLAKAAQRKERILRGWHRSFVEAVDEGRRGELQRNVVYEYDNQVRVQPPSTPVRHYFIEAGDPATRPEARRLARMLQRMDVRVYRLEAPLRVPDFHEHRGPKGDRVLPAGTFWIPMTQPQKHWIQTAMNEDAYQPIDRAYGLTGFSLALLSGARCGWSGHVLDPVARPTDAIPPPEPPGNPRVTVGIFQVAGGFWAWEGTGWARSLFEREWELPFEHLRHDDVRHGALDGIDVLLIASGATLAALDNLKRQGQEKLIEWVNAGGRIVAYRYGAANLPYALGLASAWYGSPSTGIRDVLLRVEVMEGSPIGRGIPDRRVWMTYDGDWIMKGAAPGAIVARFPSGPGFAVNGFPGGTRILPGLGVATDEFAGDGRVVTFGLDPNYRLETVGARKMLWNAMFGPDPAGRAAARPAVKFDPEAVARRAAALPADDLVGSFTVTVPRAAQAEARSMLRALGSAVRVAARSSDSVTLAIANPDHLSLEEHPFAGLIPAELERRGIEVLAFHAPG